MSITACGLLAVTCASSTWANQQPRHVSNRELTMEKSGRVVDADTGAGVPGVKIIVNWETSSTGIPGYSSTGGTWCDLQRIVTTDDNGNYTIPDVSKELDLSDRGTRFGRTAFGFASATHDKGYVLAVFKPGYVRVGDMEILKQRLSFARKNLLSSMSFQAIPDVNFRPGKVVVKPIAMQKADINPSDSWPYYSMALTDYRCSDRMANNIDQPELAQIAHAINVAIRDMPCRLPPGTTVSPETWGAFAALIHDGNFDMKFFNHVKELSGLATTAQFDPLEKSVSTTAGTLCKALAEEEKGQ